MSTMAVPEYDAAAPTHFGVKGQSGAQPDPNLSVPAGAHSPDLVACHDAGGPTSYVRREDEAFDGSCDGANQYLSFRLGETVYAFAVSITREITELTGVTRIPHAPSWVRGLISLRGTIVPVLDLKRKLEMPDLPETCDTRVIILEVKIQTEVHVFGVLADAVQSVLEIPADRLALPPRYDAQAAPTPILGVGHVQDQFVLVLDVEKVFLNGVGAPCPAPDAEQEPGERGKEARAFHDPP